VAHYQGGQHQRRVNATTYHVNDRFGSRAEELKVSTTSPLYPEKQTLARAAGMSHQGQKRSMLMEGQLTRGVCLLE
jgi:hypothetical protein